MAAEWVLQRNYDAHDGGVMDVKVNFNPQFVNGEAKGPLRLPVFPEMPDLSNYRVEPSSEEEPPMREPADVKAIQRALLGSSHPVYHGIVLGVALVVLGLSVYTARRVRRLSY